MPFKNVGGLEQKRARIWCALVTAVLLSVLLFHQVLAGLLADAVLPSCRFYQLTGFLCPSCGNTRAVQALLTGHLLQSFGYNPMIPVLALTLFILYIELVFCACGRRIRLLPRSNTLLFSVLGVVLGYDILRNFFPQMTLCL